MQTPQDMEASVQTPQGMEASVQTPQGMEASVQTTDTTRYGGISTDTCYDIKLSLVQALGETLCARGTLSYSGQGSRDPSEPVVIRRLPGGLDPSSSYL